MNKLIVLITLFLLAISSYTFENAYASIPIYCSEPTYNIVIDSSETTYNMISFDYTAREEIKLLSFAIYQTNEDSAPFATFINDMNIFINADDLLDNSIEVYSIFGESILPDTNYLVNSLFLINNTCLYYSQDIIMTPSFAYANDDVIECPETINNVIINNSITAYGVLSFEYIIPEMKLVFYSFSIPEDKDKSYSPDALFLYHSNNTITTLPNNSILAYHLLDSPILADVKYLVSSIFVINDICVYSFAHIITSEQFGGTPTYSGTISPYIITTDSSKTTHNKIIFDYSITGEHLEAIHMTHFSISEDQRYADIKHIANLDLAETIIIDNIENISIQPSTDYNIMLFLTGNFTNYDYFTSYNFYNFAYIITTPPKPNVIVETIAETKNSGSSCWDCIPPTISYSSNGIKRVDNGVCINGLCMDGGKYHTEFPLQDTLLYSPNEIDVTHYENNGPSSIQLVQLGIGVPEVGTPLSKSQAIIEVWLDNFQNDIYNPSIKEIILVDNNEIINNYNATVELTPCMDDNFTTCLKTVFEYSYKLPPTTAILVTNAWDYNRNTFNNYFNDGLFVFSEIEPEIIIPEEERECDISTVQNRNNQCQFLSLIEQEKYRALSLLGEKK